MKAAPQKKSKIPASVIQETAPAEYGTPQKIGAFAAKTHLASILDKVAHGQTFVVTKHGKPIAQIIPVNQRPTVRLAGQWRGRIWMADDFDAPLEDFKEYME